MLNSVLNFQFQTFRPDSLEKACVRSDLCVQSAHCFYHKYFVWQKKHARVFFVHLHHLYIQSQNNKGDNYTYQKTHAQLLLCTAAQDLPYISFSRYFLHNTTPSHRHGIFCLILNHRSLHMHHNLFLTVSFTYTHHNFLTTSPFFFSQLSHTNNFTKVDTFWPCKPALQPEATHYLFILQ